MVIQLSEGQAQWWIPLIRCYMTRTKKKNMVDVETVTSLESTSTVQGEVGFSMGKGSCFPPWENCFCPLDQMRNTFLSWSINTWLFFHFIFHFHSLFTMPQSPTIPPTTSSICTNTLKTQTGKPNNKIFKMLSEHECLTANVFSFIHKIQSKNT